MVRSSAYTERPSPAVDYTDRLGDIAINSDNNDVRIEGGTLEEYTDNRSY